MITNFTILGERCSGTHYVKHLICKNFDLKLTWKYGFKEYNNQSTHKHFFKFSKDYTTPEADTCLFVCIVRDPVEWIGSLYNAPYHLSKDMFDDGWESYLTHEFFSLYDNKNTHGDLYGEERKGDRHIYTGERYKDIFEARAIKCKFLFEDFPKLVKNSIFIKYEDIRDNPEIFIDTLKKKFGMIRTSDEYVKVTKYKGNCKKLFEKVVYRDKILYEYMQIINGQIDWNIENKIGYNNN